MTPTNGAGLGDSATTDPVPEDPSDVSRFVVYSLDQFQVTRAMWAANYFTLWPLGLSLVADVDVDEETGLETITGLHVCEWTHAPGEGETIDMSRRENNEAYQEFLSFVRERVLDMKVDERQAALARLTKNGPLDDQAQLLIAR